MGRQQARRTLSVLVVVVGLALAAGRGGAERPARLFAAGVRTLDVGSADPSLLAAAACRSCHQRDHETWARSRHALAFRDPVFAADFARTPRRWCLGCHAPLAQQQAEVFAASPGNLAADGVGCAVCHVRDGVVLSARPPTADGTRAHRMREDPRLSSPQLCAGCHQFNAPLPGARPFRAGTLAMQNTHAEWRASSFAARGTSCLGCHMANGSHAMAGAHDEGLLRKSVDVAVAVDGDGRVVVTARTSNVGHAFPTGDPSRSLLVEVCADEACERPLTSVSFERRFAEREGRYVLVEDTAVPPPTNRAGTAHRSLTATLPKDAAAPRGFRATYRYAPHLAAVLGKASTERVLQRGRVATPEQQR